MEYIPIGNNIGLSLGELRYDDLKYIDNMMQQMKETFDNTNKGKGVFLNYLILYNTYTCNMKNQIIICYTPTDNSSFRNIINQPFYIVHNVTEIKDIFLFFNKRKNKNKISQLK